MDRFDGIIHLAAESPVDRAIADLLAFVKTDIINHKSRDNRIDNKVNKRFYQISTDEVDGSLGENGLFTE